MTTPKTLFEKLWNAHVITTRDDGASLIYIDCHLLHEGSSHAFEDLAVADRPVARPKQTFSCADHFVPTTGRAAGLSTITDVDRRKKVEALHENSKAHGIRLFGMNDPDQGIVHVVGPEQGLTLPGMTIVCGDSHTSTHGAFGAIAFGIGASEVGHVLATQTLWQRRPNTMRITIDGDLPFGVGGKDVVLALIRHIGATGGVGHAIEFAGSTIRALSMEARMTICNMTIEGGGRMGMVAPDEKTFEYVRGRPYAPGPEHWDAAVAEWRKLYSDEGAKFDREVELDASSLAPSVTWGTSPEDTVGIDEKVPDPASAEDPSVRARMQRALDYMGLEPGTALTDVKVDRVFIGSCTNGRIEDLRAAASIVKGKKARIPAMIVPGSELVRVAAEAEGIDKVFVEAGFEWRDSGCSMCLGLNGDTISAGERCASTSNRNFEGRQGKGGRTHLVSPIMAAAAAVTGRLTDVRGMERS